MSRLIQILIAAVIVMGGLQWLVPRVAGSLLAHQLGRLDHGPKPMVAVQAVPFWALFSGRFQDIGVNAQNADLKALNVQHIRMNWSNGKVSMGSLEKGKLLIEKPGRFRATVVVTGTALSQFLAKKGRIMHPKVTIAPSGVSMSGRIQLGGTTVPLDTKGSLVRSSNHQALIFHPTSIDGLNLPVLTDVQLFNLNTLHLPMPIGILRIRLESGNRLALAVGN